jgi:hypothetical protein
MLLVSPKQAGTLCYQKMNSMSVSFAEASSFIMATRQNELTYAKVAISFPKTRPMGMGMAFELESTWVLSSSLTPGKVVKSIRGRDARPSPKKYTIILYINLQWSHII